MHFMTCLNKRKLLELKKKNPIEKERQEKRKRKEETIPVKKFPVC